MSQVSEIPVTVFLGLSIVILCVLFLPFFIKTIEHNLEAFLFIMGVIAISLSNLWSIQVIKNAIISPIHPKHPIVEAVLLAGFLFSFLSKYIKKYIEKVEEKLGLKLFVFLLVFLLGIFSSIITAIIASLILVEIISVLKLEKKIETNITVFACYSIGLGAALTPVGEPLSTIAVSRLKGEPYNADFLFLFKNLAALIIPAILLTAIIGAYISKKEKISTITLKAEDYNKKFDVIVRAIKVYIFIMALELLAEGFSPLVDYVIPRVTPEILYWVNTISAILDNATLTAAEITPKMTISQIKAMLMGLLISGGILIPGNIPNIISAGKLNITSKQWAKSAVLYGFLLLIFYYFILFVF